MKFFNNSFNCINEKIDTAAIYDIFAPVNRKNTVEREKYLILVAGGSGTRMGGKIPKQFINIRGKAVLHHTLDKFTAAVADLHVIIVLPDEWRQAWKDYCCGHGPVCRQTLVSGGITRFHSVRNALCKVPDGAVVAVHDGVRPLLSTGMIGRLFGLAGTFQAVVPAVPIVDTVKVLKKSSVPDSGIVYEAVPGETADRSRLFAAQTPQIFHSEVLKRAYCQPYSTAFTDDASVVENACIEGVKIIYPEGEKYNVKLTTPDDLLIADALLARG